MPKRFRSFPDSQSSNGTQDEEVKKPRAPSGPQVVPSITVDGNVYFADRFYLTTSVYDEDDQDGPATHDNHSQHPSPHQNPCTCGARQPPPLLDRSKLVESLQLKAAILATFSLDASTTSRTSQWLPREFPSLFGPDATVPTLVLHGQRRRDSTNHEEEDACEESSVSPDSDDLDDEKRLLVVDRTIHAKKDDKHDNTDDDDDSLCTQPGHDDKHAAIPTPIPSTPMSIPSGSQPLPNSAYLTQVLSTFLPPMALASLRSMAAPLITPEGCVSQAVIDRRKPAGAGVHHPKYLILFEQSGSVVVVVSTGNLTKPCSMDASWVQRFPAMPPNATSTESKIHIGGGHPCDFGLVLADFLQQQTYACHANQLTPLGFVRKHLQWNSLAELSRRFDYLQAQVHLVSTVPGVHVGRKRLAQHHRHPVLYGRQRVAQLLNQLSTCASCCWLPRCLLSPEDKLLIQPTSLGADWNALNMTMLVRSYLQHDNSHDGSQRSRSRVPLLERLQILWPTHKWVEEVVDWRRYGRDGSPVPWPKRQPLLDKKRSGKGLKKLASIVRSSSLSLSGVKRATRGGRSL